MDRRGRSRRGATAATSMAALAAAAAAGEGAENGKAKPFDEDVVNLPTLGGAANGPALTAPTAAVPVSARRGPAANGGGPCCQADRCGVDLTDAKRYYKRHKVCDTHAHAPVVIVAGLQQRFCQQCSRFHELSEFDDVKKSCRRRLAGHNERRRKSPADSHGGGSGRDGGGGSAGGGACRHADQSGRLPGNPPLIR